MLSQPASLRWLAWAWLAEAVLLARFYRVTFGELARTGGPGTGGVLLLLPVGAFALLLALVCVLFAWAVHQGSGIWLVKLASGLGLGAAVVIGVPVLLVLALAALAVLYSGHPLAAGSLFALPVLFAATLLVLYGAPARAWLEAHRAGQAASPPAGVFLLALAGAVALFGVLPAALELAGRKAAQAAATPALLPDELARRAKAWEDAIRADDPGPLSDEQVWRASYYLPLQSQDGDALQLAIALHKPAAVRALARQKSARELSAYVGDAMRFGSPAEWAALAEAGLSFASDDAVSAAIERADAEALRHALQAGASKEAALERAVRMPTTPRQAEKVALLLDAGASANGETNHGLKDVPHEPLLVEAVRNGQPAIAKLLVARGADPRRRGSTGVSALDALAHGEATGAAADELRAILHPR